MKNPLFNPEDFGLSTVAQIEYSSWDYEFDTRVVWKDKGGKLFTARDSGCSCPTPFDSYNTLESLDTFDWESLEDEVGGELGSRDSHVTPLLAKNFLASVKSAMSVPPAQ